MAITKGFKNEYSHWWPVIDLACRYIFVVAVVLSVGSKVLQCACHMTRIKVLVFNLILDHFFQIVPLFLLVMILLAQFFLHPYEDRIANYSETFTLLVLVALLGLGNTTVLVDTVDNSQRYFTLSPLYYLPVLVGGVTAVAYVTYHIW